MRYGFTLLLVIHGLIHLIGFIKAFNIAPINQLTKKISKPTGIVWIATTILFFTAGILFLLEINSWWLIALAGVFVSQVLVILCWRDAKFGTFANLITLLVAIVALAEARFENQYKKDVKENLASIPQDSLLTVATMAHLPAPVQRYLVFTGAVNKPVPKNFNLKFEGKIRKDEESPWMDFTSEQYNFIKTPTRLFFMKAKMKGMPVWGFHAYKKGVATMDIRLLSLFQVQFQQGDKMNNSETVTWFNDICLYAPGALVDKRIKWETHPDGAIKAIFSHQGITISALLFFNENGELVNFISEDRYRIVSNEDIQRIPFSTPTKNFTAINGCIVPKYGEAVWGLQGSDLLYGQFTCLDVAYNVKD